MAKAKYDLAAFKADVEGQMDKLRDVAPKGFNPEKFKRNLIAAVNDNEKILECTKKTLFLAVNKSAQLGFEPGFMGYCYLIPFKNKKAQTVECTFMLGYRGILELVRRSGKLLKIAAHVVYEKDHFKIDLGSDIIDHVPYLNGDRGDFKLVWARAVLDDGGVQIEFMTKDQIDKIRKGSQQKDGIPWTYHYDEMARKTVIRRICKMLPMMVEDYRFIKNEEKEEYRDVDAAQIPAIEEETDPLGAGAHGKQKPEPKALSGPPENKEQAPEKIIIEPETPPKIVASPKEAKVIEKAEKEVPKGELSF